MASDGYIGFVWHPAVEFYWPVTLGFLRAHLGRVGDSVALLEK
jgi:hypothetical protein